MSDDKEELQLMVNAARSEVQILRKRLYLTMKVLGYASSALNRCQAYISNRVWQRVFKDMAQAVEKFAAGKATNADLRVFGLEEREG